MVIEIARPWHYIITMFHCIMIIYLKKTINITINTTT